MRVSIILTNAILELLFEPPTATARRACPERWTRPGHVLGYPDIHSRCRNRKCKTEVTSLLVALSAATGTQQVARPLGPRCPVEPHWASRCDLMDPSYPRRGPRGGRGGEGRRQSSLQSSLSQTARP